MGLQASSEIVIVSAFGRGHWVASELRELGMGVTLVDVSESLGRWAPEDCEGPFGFFHSEKLKSSQLQRLDEEDYSEKIEDGFVFWPKTGPVDLRGPHSQYLLDQLQISENVRKYIAQFDELPAKARHQLYKDIAALPFAKNWFLSLAQTIASPIYHEAYEISPSATPARLFSPYFVRRVSRKGFEKSLAWLEKKGVNVFTRSKIKDVRVVAKTIESIEIESNQSGAISGEQFVWALTSEETAYLNQNALREMFADQVLKPEWVWCRYRFEIAGPQAEVLPLKFVIIQDLALPWTHSSFLLVQRTTSPQQFDVWMRTPDSHRFQKSKIEEDGEGATNLIQSRVVGSKVRLIEFPQEHRYGSADLGPARHVQYSESQYDSLKRTKFSNIHFDGPEIWETLDCVGQFAYQETILTSLKEWREEKLKRLAKLAEKEGRSD